MTYSLLRQKEVVNVCTGRRIGNVCDLELSCDGRILALIVPAPFKISGLFHNENLTIPWANVEMLGEDVILVKCPEIIPE